MKTKKRTEDYDSHLGYDEDDDLNPFVDVLLHAAFLLVIIALMAGLLFICWVVKG